MRRLGCKKIQEKIELELKAKTDSFVAKGNRAPSLAVILVGHDAASETYVNNKHAFCSRLGFLHFDYRFDEDVKEDEILSLISELNARDDVDGILVQLPLPSHIDEKRIIEAIDPNKDVDGFSPVNVGRLCLGEDCFIPCTPKGILKILEYYDITTVSKKIVILGRSNIVGKPMAMLLMRKGLDATVTVCNTKTPDIKEYTADADIIIVATGKVGTLNSQMCRSDAVIIDVGVNRIKDATREKGFRLVGDADYLSFENTDCQITPVPGGVGVMTVAMLMENTFIAAERRGN